LGDGPGLRRGFVERDGWTAGDEMGIGTRLMQKAGQIYGRGSGANDGNSAAFEAAYVFVMGTVGEKFVRQHTKHGWDIGEVSDARGNHDALAADDLSSRSGELKTIRIAGDRCYFGFFESRYKTFLKLETIRNESFNRNGKTHILVWNRLLLTVPAQRKGGLGVVKAGSEAV
jgi:hypothetical protein